MADGGTPAAITERDAELARLRQEHASKRKAETLLSDLLRPDRIERLSQYAIDPTKLEARAQEWARDRMNDRLRRLTTAQVPVNDQDRLAIALLAPPRKRVMRDGVEVEVEPNVEETRQLLAIKALREKLLIGGKGFGKSPALTAVRNTLYDRACNRLVKSVVMLFGSTGVCKTCSASHAIASIDGGRYIKAKAFCDLYTSYHRDDRAEMRVLHAAPVLVIDELTVELAKKRHLGAALDEVIDVRQGARRLTFLLGNIAPSDMVEMVDKRTDSRLGRIGTVVQIAEADRRKG